MPHATAFGPTLDASGVLASRLLEFLANKLPSAQERLGDRRLDEARGLAEKHKALIYPEDMKIARDKVLHAAEIRTGLESKSGLSKFLQAREYRKSAKEALRFVKTVSDRAMDVMLGQDRPVGSNPIQVTMDGVIDVGLCAEMKPKVTTLVQHRYNFSTSKAAGNIRSNAKRAETLLRDMNFIYPDAKLQNPYSHPIIQDAINETLFRNKDDLGIKHHEHFSPMPIPIIALILTVIQCCIEEWSDGQRKESDEDANKTQNVYSSHVSSLLTFQAKGLEERNVDVLCQLQCDLLKRAREHAGVPPYPGTESGCFPREPLAVPTSPASPDPPPDYVDIPVIVIDGDL